MHRLSKNRTLCECLGVSEAQVDAAIRCGKGRSINQVGACTGAGTGCTACHPAIEALIEARARQQALPRAAVS